MPIIELRSLTRSLQCTGKQIFPNRTDTLVTSGHYNLETELAQKADSVKIWKNTSMLVIFPNTTTNLIYKTAF